jgi:hypothetical protein
MSNGGFGYVFRKRYDPLRRRSRSTLKNLKIEEISSVTSAANPGAQVLLRKTHVPSPPKSESNMSISPVMHVAKHAFELVSKGEMSEFAYGELQQQLAKSMFPTAKNVGEAMSKFFSTHVGQSMLAARPMQSIEQRVELMKSEYGKADREPIANHDTLEHTARHSRDHSRDNLNSVTDRDRAPIDAEKRISDELENMVADYRAQHPDMPDTVARDKVYSSASGRIMLRAALEAARAKNANSMKAPERDLTGQTAINAKVGRPQGGLPK